MILYNLVVPVVPRWRTHCAILHQKKKSIASKMVSDFNKPGAKTMELKWSSIASISVTKNDADGNDFYNDKHFNQ